LHQQTINNESIWSSTLILDSFCKLKTDLYFNSILKLALKFTIFQLYQQTISSESIWSSIFISHSFRNLYRNLQSYMSLCNVGTLFFLIYISIINISLLKKNTKTNIISMPCPRKIVFVIVKKIYACFPLMPSLNKTN
jgi:hypothetical protein